jgi:hypothetical protein
MWTVVPAIYKVFTAPHIYASIFSNRHLRRYCRYHDSWMRVILQTVSKIQCMSYRLRYVNCGPEIYNAFTAPHIQALIFNWTYLRCYWRYLDSSTRIILRNLYQIQRTSSSIRCVNCGPDIYNVFTAQNIQASIINWTYLRCYWRHLDYSMSVILHAGCQKQRT